MSASGKTEPAVASARKLSPRTIAAAVLGGLVVLFAVVNLQTVTIHWIVTTTDTPLIVVIVGCGLIGFAVGWLMARRAAHHRAR
jgi:uncharacterized integral membrane protein